MAVKQSTKSRKVPATEPVTPPHQLLRAELDAAHFAIDQANSLVHVANVALRHQACDVDADVAVLLDTVYDKLKDGRDRLMNAFDVLQEVTSHG